MDLDHDEEGELSQNIPPGNIQPYPMLKKIGRIGLVSSVQRRLLFSSWYVLYSR